MYQLSNIAQHKTLLLAIALFALGIGLLSWLLLGRADASAHTPAESSTESLDADMTAADGEVLNSGGDTETAATQATARPSLIVYVSGAVNAPDVYILPPDARTKDAILAAGGFAPEADPDAINLAAPLTDGQQIRVPARGSVVSAPAEHEQMPQGASASSGGVIDLNAASAAELEELPGIGQSLAARIVEYRQANGPFASVEDLRKVRGIGASLYAQIATLVTVAP